MKNYADDTRKLRSPESRTRAIAARFKQQAGSPNEHFIFGEPR